MPGLHAQVTLLAVSGNPADHNVNGFAVEAVGVGLSDFDNWVAELRLFYIDVFGLGGLRGMAQNNHVVKIYDIGGTAPNYPIYENTFNLASSPGAIDMPMEVALCVSYRNNTRNDVFRARRRGRIYLSGWTEGANTAGRPGLTQYDGLATAYADYCLAVNALGPFEAGIWSRVDDAVYPVEEVWCDNEWDTQRRRGGTATARAAVNI